jgi:demethylmenaquinone methyltransferase/2-methoxy-6-polyprenyl-1,4-benzoquinol methylase
MSDTADKLPPLSEKRSYVRRMFTAIAPRYDLMNRLMTLGRDRQWRRVVVRLCNLPLEGRLLDVATGTGDIGYEALRSHPTVRVQGLDLTREMMLRGRAKRAGRTFSFLEGDALALPFRDGAFDAVCSGFMMRNVVDVQTAFAEQARVVKPGGRVVCLEITRPGNPLFQRLFDVYFFRYLPASTIHFPRPPALQRVMEAAGLHDVRYLKVMLGTVAIHWGTK